MLRMLTSLLLSSATSLRREHGVIDAPMASRRVFRLGDEFSTGWMTMLAAEAPAAAGAHVMHLQAQPAPLMPTAPALLVDDAFESTAEMNFTLPYGLQGVPPSELQKLREIVHNTSVGQVVSAGLGRCAVVGSSGILNDPPNATIAAEIDAHDTVVRFNDAPTVGYENVVGRKTTHRIVHRDSIGSADRVRETGEPAPQLVYMVHHASDLGARNVGVDLRERNHTNMVNVLAARHAWIINPAHIAQSRTQMLHTTHYLPSSGFEGIALALALCNGTVDLYGYGASARCDRYYSCRATGQSYYASGRDYHDFTAEAQVREQLEQMHLVRIS